MANTDAWERSHWLALQRIDGPIGEWRNDYRAALASGLAGEVDPEKLVPVWDAKKHEKYEAAQVECGRLQKAQRQLRGLT